MDSQDLRPECPREGEAAQEQPAGTTGKRAPKQKPRLHFPEDDGFHLFRVH